MSATDELSATASTPETSPSQTSTPEEGPAPGVPSFCERTGRQRGDATGTKPLVLTDVRAAEAEGYDRIVLELDGTDTAGWVVGYVDAPALEGRGEVVDLDGDTFLNIVATGTTWPAPDYDDGPARIVPHGDAADGVVDVVDRDALDDRPPCPVVARGSSTVSMTKGAAVTQLVRVHNLTVSRDGHAAGEGQSLERPFGHADPGAFFAWAGATASWPNRTDPGGSRGLEDYLVRDFHRDIGVEIMGRNKFGPQRGPWADDEWRGWWGDEPPFHTPVFVMTHHERPSFTLSDTTFHFVDGDPASVLERALEAAEGRDVRLGGGADTVRQFLDAGLVDTLHVAVAPVELGGGSRLWGSPDDLLDRYHRDVLPGTHGVVHHLFWRD